MEAAKEKLAAVNGGEVEEEEVEEVEEEVEEEEEEEVEYVEEEGEEEGGDGEGAGERKKNSPGRKIEHVDSEGKELKQHVSGSSSSGKIFVGGVAWETTEETFTNHFVKYGEITDSVIMKDKHTQMPRGFGFITFADPSVLDKVLEEEHSIDGRVVEVKRTVPREDMPPAGGPKSKKIFVGGIPTSLTDDEFKEHFSSYGVVVDHQIMVDHTSGRSRGFGFVTFESEDPVDKIISKGRMHNLFGKKVEIKRAEPKKAGGENGRGGGSFGYRGGSYGSGGGGYRSVGVGGSNYGGRGGGGGGGFFGRGGYGYGYGGGAGFVPGYGEPMYGSAAYGGGGNNLYGAAAGGYGTAYGGYGGGGGGSGRGYASRYHPYGR